jgi:hypothetical protein
VFRAGLLAFVIALFASRSVLALLRLTGFSTLAMLPLLLFFLSVV